MDNLSGEPRKPTLDPRRPLKLWEVFMEFDKASDAWEEVVRLHDLGMIDSKAYPYLDYKRDVKSVEGGTHPGSRSQQMIELWFRVLVIRLGVRGVMYPHMDEIGMELSDYMRWYQYTEEELVDKFYLYTPFFADRYLEYATALYYCVRYGGISEHEFGISFIRLVIRADKDANYNPTSRIITPYIYLATIIGACSKFLSYDRLLEAEEITHVSTLKPIAMAVYDVDTDQLCNYRDMVDVCSVFTAASVFCDCRLPALLEVYSKCDITCEYVLNSIVDTRNATGDGYMSYFSNLTEMFVRSVVKRCGRGLDDQVMIKDAKSIVREVFNEDV